jgi:tetratricopeptide (TPR) repeat protein
MLHLRWLAPFAVVLVAIGSQAQMRGLGGASVGNVHVHVVLSNDRNAGPYLLVCLMEGSGDAIVQNSYTNSIGEVDFVGVPVGDYHVRVSGDGIGTTESATFEVDNRKVSQSQYVIVNQVESAEPKPLSPNSPTVSVSDLNVPPKARKEVDKANEAMMEQNWKKALEHIHKAIAIAPQYVTAYNNMAVLYARMQDETHEEEALKKALSVDDHFPPALVNYAKLCIRQKNFPHAEELLGKAAGLEPGNAETLMLLAESQYMDRRFDAAIVTARQAHLVTTGHPAFVHYIAARSYQQENRQAEALVEFHAFLKEEPQGPRADHVRGDITKIEAATQRSAQ